MHKLGIYIPTRNRKADLKECVSRLIPQLKKYGFPIYISDNNSTDGTEDTVKLLKRDYPNIKYKKNTSKLGPTFASNLISVLSMGDTEFAWLFGDDDLVKEHAIDEIVKNLDEGYDFLQINIEVWNGTFSRRFERMKIRASEDLIYQKRDHAAVLVNAKEGYAGYLGGIITRTQYLKKELKKMDRKDLAQKDFIVTTLFFRAIVGKKGKLLAQPLIKYRTRGSLSGRDLKTWLVDFPAALEDLKPAYPESVLRTVGTLHTINLMGIAGVNKIQNPGETDTYRAYVRSDSYIGIPAKVALLATLALPNNFIKSVVYPQIKKRRDLTMEL
jgi:glycosyltransferase involved in cell wall biosynthesis